MMLCTAGLAAACAILAKFAELRVTHWQAQQEKHLLQDAEENHLQANFDKSVTCIDAVLHSNPYHFEALRYRYLLSLNAQTKQDLVKQMSFVAHTDSEKIQAAAFTNLNEGRVQEAVKTLEDVAIQTEDWELLIHVVTVLLVNAQPNVANIRRLCDLVISADKVTIMMLAKVWKKYLIIFSLGVFFKGINVQQCEWTNQNFDTKHWTISQGTFGDVDVTF